MKRAEVLEAGQIKTEPLKAEAFIDAKVKSDSMGKITKKQLREAAGELGLDYNEDMVCFAKKILNHLIKKH